MFDELERLYQAASAALAESKDSAALEAWENAYLGRKGAVTLALRAVGNLPKADRAAYGKRANEIRDALEQAYAQHAELVRQHELARQLESGGIDVTLPGLPPVRGGIHPATRTLREIAEIWREMGFQIFRTREVEDDQTNFELLNIPEHHPARDMWDTFHTTTPGVILRTHTSPGQIRSMRAYGENGTQPMRVILPGMCYRFEQITHRSEVQFHQVEGIAIGRNIRMSDLK
ncbi:MAG: phenylalanine--tRNA ligase subunit alpha, partial [Aggregatilineales bacterium]